jgi:N-acetylglucosamine-6-phosphate deacetylase
MIVLSGAELVLPDRVVSPGTLTIADGRILDIRPGAPSPPSGGFAFHGHYLVPGFIDVHVHGVDGFDVLDAGDPIAEMAGRMPRYGVTAFCPTAVACDPADLGRLLGAIRRLREAPGERTARVLPAHLESNFISPDYRGAQPAGCLRSPRAALACWSGASQPPRSETEFHGVDILREIDRSVPDVGIVTVAPELEDGLALVEWLASRGLRVSLGHSGASYETAVAAVAAGARQATHLFNRMPHVRARDPGLVGAVLQSAEVAAEVICDGFHVHPALVRAAIAAKHPSRVMAVTDGTAAAGLPRGGVARIGGVPITAGESAAFLADGTLAGGVMTMDRVFRTLVEDIGVSLVDAVVLCSTTPARELGLLGHGVLAVDAVADLVVLDAHLSVVQTYVAGRLVYARPGGLGTVPT